MPKPGIPALLERLAAEPRVTLGLLTGNIERGARMKLEPAGLNRYFSFGAFGSFGAFSTFGAFSAFSFFSFGCFGLPPPPKESSFFQNGTFSDGTSGSSAAGTGG